jgi:hypothetical protein
VRFENFISTENNTKKKVYRCFILDGRDGIGCSDGLGTRMARLRFLLTCSGELEATQDVGTSSDCFYVDKNVTKKSY